MFRHRNLISAIPHSKNTVFVQIGLPICPINNEVLRIEAPAKTISTRTNIKTPSVLSLKWIYIMIGQG
jgi:hypothetical protein